MKTYIQPAILVVRLQHQSHILEASVQNVTSNVGLCGAGDNGMITGGSGNARTRESGGVWDEEW